MEDDCPAPPSADGILHCLRFLAQEAQLLNLRRTLSAIEDALEMAVCESGMDPAGEGLHAATSPSYH